MTNPAAVCTSDENLAKMLAKLWPHRSHESNCLKASFCAMHLQRWSSLTLDDLAPLKQVRFCRWCSSVEVDGLVYET